MRVEIRKGHSYWLVVTRGEELILAIEHKRLVEVLHTANLLGFHIENLNEYQVNQWKIVS